MATIRERLLDKVQNSPGLTERELAERLFGPGTPQQRVNGYCRLLVNSGDVVRHGEGGVSDPFRYFPNTDPKLSTANTPETSDINHLKSALVLAEARAEALAREHAERIEDLRSRLDGAEAELARLNAVLIAQQDRPADLPRRSLWTRLLG